MAEKKRAKKMSKPGKAKAAKIQLSQLGAKPKIPRRKSTKLTKGEAKKTAWELINEVLAEYITSICEAFIKRFKSMKKRLPTESEENIFASALDKNLAGIRRRAEVKLSTKSDAE